MKLELKHLAPYLPYGLKIQGQTHGEIAELSAVSENSVNIKDRGFTYGWWADVFEIKPILRPLSDIGRDNLIHDEFTAIESLWLIGQKAGLTDEYLGGVLRITWTKQMLRITPLWVIERLLEWHFDVFGLIPEGLAIDINTINS